jgi:hypothetical protein
LACSDIGPRRASVARVTTVALVGVWALYFAYVLTGPEFGADDFVKTYVFSALPLIAATVCLMRARAVTSASTRRAMSR